MNTERGKAEPPARSPRGLEHEPGQKHETGAQGMPRTLSRDAPDEAQAKDVYLGGRV